MLVNEGYKVISCDFSNDMLDLARRHKATFIENGVKEFTEWGNFVLFNVSVTLVLLTFLKSNVTTKLLTIISCFFPNVR